MKAMFTVLALSVLAVSAWASENQGFYGSVGSGAYRLKSDDYKDTAPTIKLLGGYDFNDYIALEADYQELFESRDRVDGTRVETDGHVWSVSTKLAYPVTDRFAGYGRLGWSFYDLNAKATVEGERVRVSEDEDDFSWALGASYSLSDRMNLRAEYSQVDIDDGDLDFLSLILGYRF